VQGMTQLDQSTRRTTPDGERHHDFASSTRTNRVALRRLPGQRCSTTVAMARTMRAHCGHSHSAIMWLPPGLVMDDGQSGPAVPSPWGDMDLWHNRHNYCCAKLLLCQTYVSHGTSGTTGVDQGLCVFRLPVVPELVWASLLCQSYATSDTATPGRSQYDRPGKPISSALILSFSRARYRVRTEWPTLLPSSLMVKASAPPPALLR
jgi:hypothetical protein